MTFGHQQVFLFFHLTYVMQLLYLGKLSRPKYHADLCVGVFLMSAAMIFGDNAFRLQCKDFWVGGGDPNENHLSWSWGCEVAACVLSFISGALIIWLAVITARDRKYAYYATV